MAQLRDAKTGECIAEGTPQEMALLADEVGPNDVVFDDVGLAFDPATVRAKHDEHVAAMQVYAEAIKDDQDIPREHRQDAQRHAKEVAAVKAAVRARKAATRDALRAARRLAKLEDP